MRCIDVWVMRNDVGCWYAYSDADSVQRNIGTKRRSENNNKLRISYKAKDEEKKKSEKK